MRIEPVFCQNCGRRCDRVHEGNNGLPYCSRDCEITDRLILKYELPIILTIFMLFPAMIMTAQYMIDKYSPTTQTQEEQENDELVCFTNATWEEQEGDDDE